MEAPFNSRNVRRLTLLAAVASWAVLLSLGLFEQAFAKGSSFFPEPVHVPNFLKGLLLNVFILSVYWFASEQAHEQERVDFYNLLWRVFATGVICTVASVALTSFLLLIDEQQPNKVVHAFFFHIEYGLCLIVLVNAFVKWKRMALYDPSDFTRYAWQGFEYLLAVALGLHFLRLGTMDGYFFAAVLALGLYGLALSFNLRWIPYFDFTQKVYGILQLLFILFSLAYFFYNIVEYFGRDHLESDALSQSIFVAVLFVFVSAYAGAAFLVMLFNLPTSSVFEKKIKELASFQQLSESILTSASSEQVYEVLLDSAAQTVGADAAWLEAKDDGVAIYRNVDEMYAHAVDRAIYRKGYNRKAFKAFQAKTLFPDRPSQDFHSLLAIPILANREYMGTIVLLKEAHNAFDLLTVSIVRTFVAQASLAINNFRLLSHALEAQRLKGEIEIARQVQQRLLPKSTSFQDPIQVYARSEPAQAVGGDYYDFHQIREDKFAVIVADVSGKGISAAFNMAQMKGIFQSLVRLNLNPDVFFAHANAALFACLEKTSFVTASYHLIDTSLKRVYFSRAGHCPTLYHSVETDEVTYLDAKGIGLGIVPGQRFSALNETSAMRYRVGDTALLYTDGIVEAKRQSDGEEYGYDRLKEFFKRNHALPLNHISDRLLEDVERFTGSADVDDDFTIVLIRF